jgi:hypothetical protein
MPGSKFALNLLCSVRFAIAHTLSAVIYYKWYNSPPAKEGCPTGGVVMLSVKNYKKSVQFVSENAHKKRQVFRPASVSADVLS